jgi:hypothetical protein
MQTVPPWELQWDRLWVQPTVLQKVSLLAPPLALQKVLP